MRVRPTGLGAKGALFFGSVLLLFLATPYSNLFFLLTAFLSVLGAIGAVDAVRNLRGLGIAAASATAAPVGAGHAVELRLAHGPRRRSFAVEAALELDGAVVPFAGTLFAVDGTVLQGQVEGLARGVHRVTAVRLRSRHPIGICRVERSVPCPELELVAYPRPATFAGDRQADDPRDDATARALAANDESIAGLREWRDGDALREVHWRATARRGTPVVRERERDVGDGLDVVVDRRCGGDALERALAIATALVLDAVAKKQPLRLRSQGFEAAHTADRPARAAMLRWLALAQPLPRDAAAPPACAPTAIRLPAMPQGGGA